MQKNLYFSAVDIQKMLGVSRAKAYRIVQDLNIKLGNQGYIVIQGRVPKKFFADNFYGCSEALS